MQQKEGDGGGGSMCRNGESPDGDTYCVCDMEAKRSSVCGVVGERDGDDYYYYQRRELEREDFIDWLPSLSATATSQSLGTYKAQSVCLSARLLPI